MGKQPNNLLTTLLIGLLLSSCSFGTADNKSDDRNDNEQDVTPAVQAVQARYGTLPLVQRLTGTIKAENQVALFPEISARVLEVYVENGDQVTKGQPLVKLNDKPIVEQLKQAEANLKINKAQLKQAKAGYRELNSRYKRQKELADRDLISDMEIEILKSQLESAQADVELAEAQVEQSQSQVEEQESMLQQTIVRAPVKGTVGQRNVQPGMLVNTNSQLFLVGELDKLRIEVVLTDKMLSYIEVGQTARIFVSDENDEQQTITGEVSRISPFLNDVTRSTEAEIDVNNPNGLLKPGMFVPVDILYGESRKATLIPKSSLYDNPNTGETGIYVAKSIGLEVQPVERVNPDNPPPLTEALPVTFMPVEIIARGRMEVAVNGVDQGQWVVTIGQDLLSDGTKTARVRTVAWDRVVALQQLQRQELLKDVLNKADSVGTNDQTL